MAIKRYLRNDSVTITSQDVNDINAKVVHTFYPVRVRSRQQFSQMVYGMENSASWEIWFDMDDINDKEILFELLEIDAMITFETYDGQSLSVRVASVDYLKKRNNIINHIKVVCI